MALVGDVLLNGVPANLNSNLTVRVRVARFNLNSIQAATSVVTLRAPLREWAQLPARTALAIADALQVSLSEDERINLLREASPLMPSISPFRLMTEERLGTAQAAQLEAQWLLWQSRRSTKPAVRRGFAQSAARQSALALQALNSVAKTLSSTRIANTPIAQERDALVVLRATTQSWIVAANKTSRESRLFLTALKGSAARR
jgi:hypothetical protein